MQTVIYHLCNCLFNVSLFLDCGLTSVRLVQGQSTESCPYLALNIPEYVSLDKRLNNLSQDLSTLGTGNLKMNKIEFPDIKGPSGPENDTDGKRCIVVVYLIQRNKIRLLYPPVIKSDEKLLG